MAAIPPFLGFVAKEADFETIAHSQSLGAWAPVVLTGVVTGVATATDAELDALRYSGTTTTAKGSVIVASNGGFTYTPTDDARAAAGAPGATRQDKQDTFDVVVDDGHGGTLTIAVKVPVVAAPALGVLV